MFQSSSINIMFEQSRKPALCVIVTKHSLKCIFVQALVQYAFDYTAILL